VSQVDEGVQEHEEAAMRLAAVPGRGVAMARRGSASPPVFPSDTV
jgi:hypothetical protein